MSRAIKIPQYEKMRTHVFNKLENELDPRLYYHGIQHTRDHVLPATEHLAYLENIKGEPLILLLSAAALHDIGYINQYENNEVIAASIAAELLPEFSYTQQQIEVIKAIIMATALPQTANTILEKVMCDADFCHFGSNDFITLSNNLWRELIEFGYEISKEQWHKSTLDLLSSHSYWTKTASIEWDKIKQYNIGKLLLQ
ncbi:MAG: HD domain-containing protein [Methylobacter sp.]|nr:MAG: HD domain-containing protein [Methylobacter sp.]